MARIGEAKRRALHIPLRYRNALDLNTLAKYGFAAVVALVVVGWLFTGYLQPNGGVLRYSPAPVAAVHQMWETECGACHLNFTPIRDDAAFASWKMSSEDSSQEALPWSRASDRLCQRCHLGPEHHPTQIPSEVGSCASCHQDHQGRSADLVRVGDHACTRCHANLKEHRREVANAAPLKREIDEQVTSFAKQDGHPDFHLPAKDPGNVYFTHGRHMSPGLQLSNEAAEGRDAAESSGPMVLNDVAEEDRARYRDYVDPKTGFIQLRCDACHRSDAADAEWIAGGRAANFPAPSSGAYMLPISFDRDCRGCHTITVPVQTAPSENAERAGRLVNVPHGLSGVEIQAVLTNAFLRQADEGVQAFARTAPVEEIKRGETTPDVVQLQSLVQAKTSALATEVAARCNECHVMGSAAEASRDPALAVKPADIPQVWFQHARFDHAGHRALTCKECHPGAYDASHEDPKTAHQKVMIPKRELCVQCHRPKLADGSPGARHDCVECHQYHAGVRSGGRPHGPGAQERNAAPPEDPAEQETLRQLWQRFSDKS